MAGGGTVLLVVVLVLVVSLGLWGLRELLEYLRCSIDARNVRRRAVASQRNAEKRHAREKRQAEEALARLGALRRRVYEREVSRFVQTARRLVRVDLSELADREEFVGGLTPGQVREFERAAMKARDVLVSGVGASAAGAVVSAGAYGTMMTFGVASTGTAIGSLSGAAATNATMAAFGGGAISAGGLGIAGGTIVLGAVAVAPAVLVLGLVARRYGDKALARAKAYAEEVRIYVESVETASVILRSVATLAKQYEHETRRLAATLRGHERRLRRMIFWRRRFERFKPDQQAFAQLVFEEAQVLKKLLDMPLIAQDGAVHNGAVAALEALPKGSAGDAT